MCLFLTPVQIELIVQILLRAYAIVVVGVWGEELEVATRTRR
jgi:hypothetical protein